MNSAGLIALDNGCRGAAVGLLLMIAALRLRDGPATASARLGGTLALAGAAYAIVSAPESPSHWHWWSLPILAISFSGPVAFWLWARAAFDDDFSFRPWHGGIWATLVGLKLLLVCGTFAGTIASIIDRALTFSNLALAVLACAQTLATWSVDLVDGRRRLRIAVLLGTLAYIVIDIASNLIVIAPLVSASAGGSLGRAFGLCLLALLAAYGLFRIAPSDQALASPPVSALTDRDAPIENGGQSTIEPALLARLERLMTVERTYRRDGLTIGSLAELMGLPEYRLRQIINQGLGHRNFNAFLNRYRIDEAKAALGDPSQKDVPVLTIAMDAGFQSLGPFNRAFKADTGQTPTEFRRLALNNSPVKPLNTEQNFEIGEPAEKSASRIR